MPRKCTVCHHPQRQAIDRALLAGATLASLAEEHQLSTSALSRHHHHLKQRLDDLVPLLRQQQDMHYLVELHKILRQVAEAAQAFALDGQPHLVLKSAREAAHLVKTMRPLHPAFSPLTVFHLLHCDQYVTEGPIVTTNPAVYAAERRSVADAFLAPCPDAGHLSIATAPPLDHELPVTPAAHGDMRPGNTSPAHLADDRLSTHQPVAPSTPQAGANGTEAGHNGTNPHKPHSISAAPTDYNELDGLLAALVAHPPTALYPEGDDGTLPRRYRLRNPSGLTLYDLNNSLIAAAPPPPNGYNHWPPAGGSTAGLAQ